MDPTGTTAQQIELGRRIFGPLFAGALLRLRQMEICLAADAPRSVLLFAGPGSGWLCRLYRRFCDSAGYEPLARILLLHTTPLDELRLACGQDPDAGVRLFRRVCPSGDLRLLLHGLLGETWESAGANPPSGPAEDLAALLGRAGPFSDRLHALFAEQRRFIGKLAEQIPAGRCPVLVVGSTCRSAISLQFLACSITQVEWAGACLGLTDAAVGEEESSPQWCAALMYDGSTFHPDRPQSAFNLCPQFLANCLLADGDTGKFSPSLELVATDPGTWPEQPASSAPSCWFQGISRYLAEEQAMSPASVLAREQEALPALAQLFAFPNATEAGAVFATGLEDPLAAQLRILSGVVSAGEEEGEAGTGSWEPGRLALTEEAGMVVRAQEKCHGWPQQQVAATTADRVRSAAKDLAHQVERRCAEPLVAVITRTMDRPVVLARALESVAAQSMRSYEHLVICDGGPAGLAKETILRSNADLRRVRLIDNVVNRGMEAASNIAISRSRARYILIHDDDDSLETGFLQETVAFLEQEENREYGGVVTWSMYVSEEIQGNDIVIHGRRMFDDTLYGIYYGDLMMRNLFPPISFLFRRSLYDRVGGFDERLPVLGDWDFNLRALRYSDIAVLPRPLANYHHRDVGADSAGVYGNTVISGLETHRRYDVLIRNRYARMDSGAGPALPVLMALGRALQEIRGNSHLTAVRIDELIRLQQERGAEFQALRQQLDCREAELCLLRQQLEQTRRQIREFRASTSWRLTAPLRMMSDIFAVVRRFLRSD